jgi:hypothetical protein
MRIGRRIVLAILTPCLLAEHALAKANIITLATDGAWTWFNDPRAIYDNGTLYFGYVRNEDGRTVLSAFQPRTAHRTDLWISTQTEKDDHDNPGLLLKQDGRILAIYSRHNTDQFFSFRTSTKPHPDSPADWSPEQRIPASGAGVTYANPFQLSAERGKIYNFTRDLNFNPTVFASTNGGETWPPPRLFIETGSGRTRPYVKYCSDSNRRIDFLYTDGHPRDVKNSLYHAFYQQGALYKTDGSLLKSFNDIPLLHSSGQRGSVIYQYSETAASDPNDHIPSGRAWCWEIAYQTDGHPFCVFSVRRDHVTGTNWFDRRIYYSYARWTGKDWQKRFIAHAGRNLYRAEEDYAGGICLDPDDANVVYISSNAANPFNLSDTDHVPLRADDRYEIWKGTTRDGGLSFDWQPVTSNSSADNLRPYVPRHSRAGVPPAHNPTLLSLRGVYRSYTSHDCSIVGLFPERR